MDDLCSKISEQEPKILMGDKLPQDDVVEQSAARASVTEVRTRAPEGELPPKKRKTRRGKSKRKQPYSKNSRKSNKLIKPEAPHNSNQFLLEDHGCIEDLDKNLKRIDQASPSTLTRTRDSSFSVDTDGEFYSSPDDEEQFLIKDFDDQYESLHAERLQAMSKAELVSEYLQLENRLEQLTKKQQTAEDEESEDSRPDLKHELERLTMENERLRRENEMLRNQLNDESDSEDSETDSSESCSSSSSESSCNNSSCSSRSRSPITVTDYTKTNGHVPRLEPV